MPWGFRLKPYAVGHGHKVVCYTSDEHVRSSLIPIAVFKPGGPVFLNKGFDLCYVITYIKTEYSTRIRKISIKGLCYSIDDFI